MNQPPMRINLIKSILIKHRIVRNTYTETVFSFPMAIHEILPKIFLSWDVLPNTPLCILYSKNNITIYKY